MAVSGLAGRAVEFLCRCTPGDSHHRPRAASSSAGVSGSTNSSNSIRMVEVARRLGGRAELVPDVPHFDPAWPAGVSRVGVSVGAEPRRPSAEPAPRRAVGPSRPRGRPRPRTTPGEEHCSTWRYWKPCATPRGCVS